MSNELMTVEFDLGTYRVECRTDLKLPGGNVAIRIDGKDARELYGNPVSADHPDIMTIVTNHIVSEYLKLLEVWREIDKKDA